MYKNSTITKDGIYANTRKIPNGHYVAVVEQWCAGVRILRVSIPYFTFLHRNTAHNFAQTNAIEFLQTGEVA